MVMTRGVMMRSADRDGPRAAPCSAALLAGSTVAGTPRAAAASASPSPAEAPLAGVPSAAAGAEPASRVPVILVIEDDADVCRTVTDWLEDAGYEVLIAYTAIAGLAQARDRRPNLLLLDLRLPDLDGLTLLTRLGADPRTSALPVLVISGHLDAATRAACRMAGVRDVLEKPFQPEALLELVAAHVGVPSRPQHVVRRPGARWESTIAQGISRLVHADLDATRVCQAVVDGAQELIGLAAASLWLLHGEMLELCVQSPLFDRAPRAYTRIPVGEGLIGRIARERRPLTTADARRDPNVKNRATFEALGLRAFVGVPLLHDGRLLGVLSGARLSSRPFEAEDLQMLEALAEHAAAVLEQARLLQESQQRRQTAEALAALAAELSAADAPTVVLERVLDYVQQLVAADIPYLAVLEPHSGATPVWIARGARSPRFSQIVPGLGKGIVGWIMLHGEPFRTSDYLSDPRISHDFDDIVREEGITTAMSVPVRLKGRVVGVLGAQRREPRPFTDDDERVLIQLAAQAAVALDNVWLFRQVERVKQQWETTVDHLPEGLALLDQDLRLVQVNRTLAGWVGADRSGLAGRPVGEVLPAYATTAGAARLARAQAGGEPQAAEFEEPGSGRVFEETLAPVTDAGGRPAGLVVTLRDVTEARRLQAQLARTDKLASLGEMLAGVAHELNNPLTGVLGFAQLLEAQVEDPAVREDLRKIASEAQRAARLVQRLLAFARQYPPERRPTQLNALVQAAVELLEVPCRHEGIAFETDLAADLPLTWADPHQLQQVVVNLVTNARQAMVGAGRRGRIRLSTRLAGGFLELRVADEGPGIPASVLPRIFDPFFTTKAPGEGTGLGLSVCHSVVSAHGGSIWAESRPGEGATFYVRVPVVALPSPGAPPPAPGAPVPALAASPQAAAAPHSAIAAPEPALGPASAPGTPAGERSLRVLVAEDEPALRELALEALAPRGHVVETVPDGNAALERLRRDRYDVLLLDLRMPGLDGHRLVERLAAEQTPHRPRIVLMTGDSVRPETRAWLAATKLPVIDKPFTLEALVALVEGSTRSEGSGKGGGGPDGI